MDAFRVGDRVRHVWSKWTGRVSGISFLGHIIVQLDDDSERTVEPNELAPERPPFAPVALDEDGKPVVICERCGSRNLDYDGADIDKCRDCGHWRYR